MKVFPQKETRFKMKVFGQSRKYYKKPLLKKLQINNLKLRKHQYKAVFQLNKHISRDCLLDQPMGSGKTRAVLAFLLPTRSRILFLTLAPIVDHIRREVARLYTPTQRRKIEVMSYSSFIKKKSLSYQCIVLDEIHTLPSRIKTKKALRTHKYIRFIGLTGTTTINHRSLVAQLKCLPHRPAHIQIHYKMPQPHVVDIPLTMPHGLLEKCRPFQVPTSDTLGKWRRVTQIRKILSLAKVEHMLTILRSLPTWLKIVCCSEFLQTLQALRTANSTLITCRKDIHLLESFKTNPDLHLLFCTRTSINNGVDLGFVDLFFLMEPVYKVHQETQLLARTTRMSQQPKYYNHTHIYRLRYLTSLEDRLFHSTHHLYNWNDF